MAAADLWVGDFTAKVSPSRGMQFWSESAWGGEPDAASTFPTVSRGNVGRMGDFESATNAAVTITPTSQSSHTPAATATFLATPPSIAPSSNATKDSTICKYFATGGCTRGELCSYRHDLTIDAATDADVSRGFVLMGQVVNLKHSAAAQKQQQSQRGAANATPPHSMNPDARPFVSVGEDAAVNDVAAMMESQYAAATSYQHNIRQPPLRFQAAAAPPHMEGYYGDNGGYSGAEQQQYEQSTYSGGYSDYYEGQQPYGGGGGEDMSMYQNNHHYAYNNNQYSSSMEAKWKPTGVFSTTAETAAAKSVLAGYYDHALLNKEAVYQHRRFQAMRPPLQSNKPGGAANSSSSSLEDDSFDANARGAAMRTQQQGGQVASAPTTWTYYPKPSSMDTVHHNYQSADTHRKLRNRPEF